MKCILVSKIWNNCKCVCVYMCINIMGTFLYLLVGVYTVCMYFFSFTLLHSSEEKVILFHGLSRFS